MSDQLTTPVAARASTERDWSPAPAFTLLAVIVLWYLGVAALLVSNVV